MMLELEQTINKLKKRSRIEKPKMNRLMIKQRRKTSFINREELDRTEKQIDKSFSSRLQSLAKRKYWLKTFVCDQT